MTQRRTYGARILLGVDSPALPGWADVWRSALRASHPWRLPVSFLSQVAAGKSAARDDKGEGGPSVESGCWLTEPQVPPLRFAPVGMTIHILVGVRVPKKNCHPDKKVRNSNRSVAEQRACPERSRMGICGFHRTSSFSPTCSARTSTPILPGL